MKLLFATQRRVVMTAILACTFACVAVLASGLWRHATESKPAVSKVATSNDKSAKPSGSPVSVTNQTTQAPAIESSSPACQQFTLAVAKTILGPDVAINAQDSVIVSDTPDLLTSSCIYRNSDSVTVRLSAYIAKSSRGESANTVYFGSDKPAGAQDITGYGQAAYWDVHTNVMSVLKNNNRYELWHSSNALDQARQAADNIVPKL